MDRFKTNVRHKYGKPKINKIIIKQIIINESNKKKCQCNHTE